MDVTEWLRGLGPEQYAPAFHDNNINAKILSSLTGEDLRELGVISVGHARRLLDAVAGIPGGPTVNSPPISTQAIDSVEERRTS